MSKGKIVIIDYGMGNLHTVLYKFRKLNADVVISSDRSEIETADKIILPGVGHFAAGMKNLNDRGLRDILDKKAMVEKVPVLGICLGMQLLTNFSEEGNVNGLSWINASTVRFNKEKIGALKIPHMGWNTVAVTNDAAGIMNGIGEESYFYFVHSFYVKCEDSANVMCKTVYGMEFDSAIVKENILGFQFHPEKSHDSGLVLLKNFINYT